MDLRAILGQLKAAHSKKGFLVQSMFSNSVYVAPHKKGGYIYTERIALQTPSLEELYIAKLIRSPATCIIWL